MNKVKTLKIESPIMIYYMFYNKNHNLLSKRIPHKLIYDEEDINNLSKNNIKPKFKIDKKK